jgi:hypothetical protein
MKTAWRARFFYKDVLENIVHWQAPFCAVNCFTNRWPQPPPL